MHRSVKAFLIAGTLLATAASCGSDLPLAVEPLPEVNTVVFTRDNQTRVNFVSGAKLYVWCGAWEPGAVATPSVHIAFGGPASDAPFWRLSAVVSDITLGQPLSFPNTFVFDQPRRADLYVYDPTNELSTQSAGSSGAVIFQALSCVDGGRVEFAIDAVAGSEFSGGPSVSASGLINGTVGQPPP